MTRWHVLALLFAARVDLGIKFQAMGSAYEQLSDAFGLSHAQIGLMIGLFMAPGMFLTLPAGYAGRLASDRLLRGLGLTGFLTIYYAIITAAPPQAGWTFDRTGASDAAIMLGIAQFAVVLPAAMLFRIIKLRPEVPSIKQIA